MTKYDPYTSLTTKRNDIRFFFNRTKKLWTLYVLDADDAGVVTSTFHAKSLEVVQPSYTLESDPGMLGAFGIIKKRKDKDEIQITNI